MDQGPVPSWGAHLPPSLLIKRKGDGASRPNSRAGKAKNWLKGGVSGPFREEAGMA